MLDFNPATKEETGDITQLTTTDKTSLVKASNEIKSTLDTHKNDTVSHVTSTDKTNWNGKADASKVGDITQLTSADKTSTVAAINESLLQIGILTSLTTTQKTNLVGAVNELDSEVGTLSSLTTTAKTTVVSAVNELDGEIGTLTGLTTSAKTNLVSAINENVSKINEIKSSGATASRPTPTYIGQPYFDTTLGKPIWAKTITPVAWVDSTGTAV